MRFRNRRRPTWGESATVNVAGPKLPKCFEMLRSGVTLVIAEAVLRKLVVVFGHEAVARDFGEDAGGGDRKAFRVAIDQRRLGIERGENMRAVDERVIGTGVELKEGVIHRAEAGAKNVDGVDDFDIGDGDCVRNERRGGEEGVEAVAFFFGELLGVVQALEFSWKALVNPFGGQANYGGYDGPGEGTPASFIRASDAGASAGETFAFVFEFAGPHDRDLALGVCIAEGCIGQNEVVEELCAEPEIECERTPHVVPYKEF